MDIANCNASTRCRNFVVMSCELNVNVEWGVAVRHLSTKGLNVGICIYLDPPSPLLPQQAQTSNMQHSHVIGDRQ